MRAFLVLLLALAIAAGVFFFQQSKSQDDTKNGDPGLEGPEVPETDNTGGDVEVPDDSLVAPGVDAGRTVQSNPEVAEGPGVVITESGTGVVRGNVVDRDGKAIPGADVMLTKYGAASLFFMGPEEVDRSTDLTTTADDQGAFLFENVPAFAMYTLSADHENYARTELSNIDTTGGASITQNVVLQAGTRMYGVVQDVQGNVVPEAKVVLTPTALGGMPGSETIGSREVLTSNTGNFEFLHCAKGPHVLTVSATGYGQATVQNINIADDEEVERNVELEAAQLLGGRVVDENSNPIEGAVVEAFSIGNRQNKTQTKTTCDADGRFEFSDVSGGSYTLRAAAKGYKSEMKPRVSAGELDLIIQLIPLPTVSGQVLDGEGNPITEYTINLRQGMRNSDLSMFVGGTRKQIKDPEGRYKILVPMKGDYMTEATAGNYAPSLSETFTVTEGQNLTGVNITVKSGGVLRGRMVDKAGNPVAGVSIKTNNNDWFGGPFDQSLGQSFPGMSTKKTTRSGADGTFVLRGLHPTSYLVQFDHSDYAQTAMRNIVISEGTETNVKDVLMEAGSTVTGMVRGPGGTALSGATINLMLNTKTEFPLKYAGRTKPDGSYSIDHVRSGTYNIHAQRPSVAGDNPFAGAGDAQKTQRKITISGDGTYQGEDFEISD